MTVILFYVGTLAPINEAVSSSDSDLPVYQEVWFIALIAILALVILFIGLACCIRATGHKVPYIRERMPLQPKQKKMAPPFAYCVDPYNGSIISTVRDILYLFILPVQCHCSESIKLKQPLNFQIQEKME